MTSIQKNTSTRRIKKVRIHIKAIEINIDKNKPVCKQKAT